MAGQIILKNMLVQGILTYSSGGACGKPVIHLGLVAISANLADYEETFKLDGQRMATKAMELFS